MKNSWAANDFISYISIFCLFFSVLSETKKKFNFIPSPSTLAANPSSQAPLKQLKHQIISFLHWSSAYFYGALKAFYFVLQLYAHTSCLPLPTKFFKDEVCKWLLFVTLTLYNRKYFSMNERDKWKSILKKLLVPLSNIWNKERSLLRKILSSLVNKYIRFGNPWRCLAII